MKRKMHIVSNTHWDREHRHGFQETRLMLADVMDRLVNIMERDPEYKHFVLDGQTVPLDDYFALKPHMRDRVTALVKAGRLHVGPWYSLVDTFSVSPECIVRNLVMGHRVAHSLGGVMKFGYSVFSFGQMAQLPQIYGGFGIHDVIFYKGADKNILKKSEFIWEAPDGTRALTSRLGKFHRVNFFWRFTIPVILGGDPDGPGEWSSSFTNGLRMCHLVDQEFCDQNALELDRDIRIRDERLQRGVEETIACAEPDTLVPDTLLFFDGIDFATALAEMPEALRRANEQCTDLGKMVHSTPMDYFSELRKKLKLDKLHVHRGDIRMTAVDHVHSESMGANIEIMRALGRAERTLINVAEPFVAWAVLGGAAYPQEALDLAWKYLFQVHAHDSIHGLGVPKIKRDSIYRIDQAQEIADGIARRGVEGVIAKLDTSKATADDIFVTVFNPAVTDRGGVMELQLDTPNTEYARHIWLETLDRRRLESWVLDREIVSVGMVSPESRPKPMDADRWNIEADIPAVPAFGYRTLRLRREKADYPAGAEIFSSGQFPFEPIGKGARTLDNGLVRIEVGGDGLVRLTDHKTGAVYDGLLELVDHGCRGDTWVHHAPNHDKELSSAGTVKSIRLVQNSGLRATVEVVCVLPLPIGLSTDRETRLAETVAAEITTRITLTRGSRRVDVVTAFENRARDHFLRVRLPTPFVTNACVADAPFDVCCQEFAFTNHNGVRGPELARRTMSSWVDVGDSGKGLAVLVQANKEYALDIGDGGQAVLELSLLRAVNGRFPIDEHTFIDLKDDFSQCLGAQTFAYALYPHAGDWRQAGLAQRAAEYLNPLVAAEFGKGRLPGKWPLESASLFRLKEQKLLFSGIKRSEDGAGWIIRLYNPGRKVVRDELVFFQKPAGAAEVQLDETNIRTLPVGRGGRVSVTVPRGRIFTLAVRFA